MLQHLLYQAVYFNALVCVYNSLEKKPQWKINSGSLNYSLWAEQENLLFLAFAKKFYSV